MDRKTINIDLDSLSMKRDRPHGVNLLKHRRRTQMI